MTTKTLTIREAIKQDEAIIAEHLCQIAIELEHPAVPKYLDYFEVEIELGKGFVLWHCWRSHWRWHPRTPAN